MTRGSRIRSAPTVEGWGLAFIACCLLASSFIQRVNLLVLVFGLLAALLLVGWVQARRNLSRIAVRRVLPQETYAGAPFEVAIEAVNDGFRDAFAVSVVDELDLPNQLYGEALFAKAAKRSTAKAKYAAISERRGRVAIGPMTVGTRFPFGLFQARRVLHSVDEMVVFPALGEMTDSWRRLTGRASDSSKNLRPSPERVQEEFHGLRDYREGDNLRHIHWLTTARRGQPVVKEFETLSARDVLLFVDPFAPDPAVLVDPHVETALSLAATACVDFCRRFGSASGRIVVVLAGQTPTVVQGQASSRLVDAALRAFALAEFTFQDDWRTALDKLGPNQVRGAQAWFIGTRPMDHMRREYGMRFGFRFGVDAATIDVTADQHRAFFRRIDESASASKEIKR